MAGGVHWAQTPGKHKSGEVFVFYLLMAGSKAASERGGEEVGQWTTRSPVRGMLRSWMSLW